jgi:glycosyltransferase involved in cell wall biosynthesis
MVTVGVPVFNGGTTLHRAVESILRQTHRGCVVHISDNASTDATAEVGAALAAEHDEVSFTRQTFNLGASGNFRFLLQQAETKYFMWLAADDYIEPGYVERMLEALEADLSLVACVSQVRFVRPDGSTRLSNGTYPLLEDPVTNLAVYFSSMTDNARIYGVHRTVPLQKAFPPSHFHAFDWSVVAGILLYGKYGEIKDVLMVRDDTPRENYLKAVRYDNSSRSSHFFPLARMNADLIFRQRIPLRPSILKALLYLNMEKHYEYMRAFHPSYANVTSPAWRFWKRNVAWRLRRSPTPDGQ